MFVLKVLNVYSIEEVQRQHVANGLNYLEYLTRQTPNMHFVDWFSGLKIQAKLSIALLVRTFGNENKQFVDR